MCAEYTIGLSLSYCTPSYLKLLLMGFGFINLDPVVRDQDGINNQQTAIARSGEVSHAGSLLHGGV